MAVAAVVGAVAAPPLSTRAGPQSPRQGPRTTNHSGAREEAPPLPGTSATSEEGEQGEDAEGKGRDQRRAHPAEGALGRVPPRPWALENVAPGYQTWASRLILKTHFTTPQCTRGRRQEHDQQP